jgi:hypothetical protein
VQIGAPVTRAALVLALIACGKSDKPAAESKPAIESHALAAAELELPDGWTKAYEPTTDTWQLASQDAKITVRVEHADARYVASPDAYAHHLAHGRPVTIEQRKNVNSGFAMTLRIDGVRAATVVVRELGSAWYRCSSETADDDATREQVIALCRSVRL